MAERPWFYKVWPSNREIIGLKLDEIGHLCNADMVPTILLVALGFEGLRMKGLQRTFRQTPAGMRQVYTGNQQRIGEVVQILKKAGFPEESLS